MALSAASSRILMRQLQEVQADPVEGVNLHVTDSLQEIDVEMVGPEGTPFAGGLFQVRLVFDEAYPTVPPKAYFRTKIFHPNISERGDVCVNTLKKDWTPDVGVRHILVVIRCLLIEPNPESALNEEAGRLLLEDYQEYAKRARMICAVHAGGTNENSQAAAKSGDPTSAQPLRAVDNNNSSTAKQTADRKKALKRL